jgi:tRNA pseudouridine38-40 synthase
VIERRLAEIFSAEIRIHGSGRTDAGVHALEQVFHFDAGWRHAPEKLLAALRSGLPPGIQIRTVRPAPADFHARFSATGKRYIYHLYLGEADPFTRSYCWSLLRPVDLALMREAAGVLQGRHDFRAFTAVNGVEREDTVRDLRRLEVLKSGRRIRIVAEADGFMYKMVRSLAGVVVAAGEGRLEVAELGRILAGGKRVPAVQTAPPRGLFLAKVFYR